MQAPYGFEPGLLADIKLFLRASRHLLLPRAAPFEEIHRVYATCQNSQRNDSVTLLAWK
jgi:hypothetical protein